MTEHRKNPALRLRDEALLYMKEAGLERVRRPVALEGLSPHQAYLHDSGLIEGLPWLITVRARQTADFNEAIQDAAQRASDAGRKLYASIQRRRSYEVHDSYVTMPLHVFTQVLRQLYSDAGAGSLH